MKDQGHGPQRHEGQVNSAQHDQRVINGIDPATGKREFYAKGRYAGQPVEPPKTSSSFRSNEAYAQAEAKARGTDQFRAESASGADEIRVRQPLESALGTDYLRHVEGRTTVGVGAGSTRAVDFEGGTVLAVYRRQAGGSYALHTMFPEGR